MMHRMRRPTFRPLLLLLLTAIVGAQGLAQAQTAPATATVESTPCCGPVTAEGQRVLKVLDDSDVEHLWLNHRHVNWQTGEPDEPENYAGHGNHSHCSAFAAAIGQRLNIYMLRPPEHSQILLASAQTQWFGSASGKDAGWIAVHSAEQAQTLANRGHLVVISYESPNVHKPGHIVIIRPSLISAQTLSEQGPDIIQAGDKNYLTQNAKAAFKWHAAAWPNDIKYFAHAVPAQPLNSGTPRT